jgi:putative ABC transport system permease protein
VEDAKYRSLRDEDVATVYRPLAQSRLWGAHMNFAVRLDGDPAAAIPMVTSVVGGINHSISLEFVTLREQVAASLARPRLLATLSVFFGTLALLLATVGLYGTVAYSVARRHNEIGIRIALGAERAAVVRMVLGEVARLLVTGTVVGVAIAAVSTRLLVSFLFGLTPTDPFTLAASVAALATVALAAGAIPAWRAARVDPVEALREE